MKSENSSPNFFAILFSKISLIISGVYFTVGIVVVLLVGRLMRLNDDIYIVFHFIYISSALLAAIGIIILSAKAIGKVGETESKVFPCILFFVGMILIIAGVLIFFEVIIFSILNYTMPFVCCGVYFILSQHITKNIKQPS